MDRNYNYLYVVLDPHSLPKMADYLDAGWEPVRETLMGWENHGAVWQVLLVMRRLRLHRLRPGAPQAAWDPDQATLDG